MSMVHLKNAQFHLREARAHLVLMGEIAIADRVQDVLNRCGATERALQRARDLGREAERERKARKRRTWGGVHA